MISDQIGDLLTRIRNATMIQKEIVKVPFSNIKMRILEILEKEKFIKSFERKFIDELKIKSEIIIKLKYKKNVSVIIGIKRISKPGLRKYVSFKKIPYVLNSLGIAIISTSKGLITDKEARNSHLGGEVIAFVW